MQTNRQIVYSSPRLSICGALPADAEYLHELLLANPEVMRLAFAGRALSLEESKSFCAEKLDFEAGGKKPGVLIERDSARVIGIAGLIACDDSGAPDYEIGFLLAPSAWGKGYATEIGRAQLDFGFFTLGCQRMLAKVSPENSASIAVLEKLGMHWLSTEDTPDRGKRHFYCKQREL